jgi:FixJ family two-component response regulator
MKPANAKILIADDEKAITSGLGAILVDEGYGIEIAEDGQKALDRLAGEKFGVVLADLKMPKLDGIALLKAIRERKIPTEFIMITGQGSTELAIEAIKQGAVDYIEKPLNTERLNKLKAQIPKLLDQFALQEKNRELTAKLEGLTHYGELTGQSESMRAVYQVIDAVAPSSASVLILGESGTGKELVARAMHQKKRTFQGTVLRAQLRRAAKGNPRERIVRSREGRLHGIDEREARRIRNVEWGHALSRRSRRDGARHSSEAAPSPRVAHGAPPRRQERDSGRHSCRRGDEQGSPESSSRGRAPRRPLLPHCRRRDLSAAAS